MTRSFARQRLDMVDEQLRTRGLSDERVLAAMSQVPREEFVRSDDVDFAYTDGARALACGQTISQPYIVALMCEKSAPQSHERVLDVGTGCGYAAAVLSRLAAEVHSVECIPELATSAKRRLRRLGYENVTVHVGDGGDGLPEAAPYDVILVAAAASQVPQPLIEQLANGGRLIIPVRNSRHGETLMLFVRNGTEITSKSLGGCVFVPLVGKHGLARPDCRQTS